MLSRNYQYMKLGSVLMDSDQADHRNDEKDKKGVSQLFYY